MNTINKKELTELLKILRKHSVVSFEGYGFQIKLGPQLENKENYGEQSENIPVENAYSEEDILNWSSPLG
jgi:hypothetical protein